MQVLERVTAWRAFAEDARHRGQRVALVPTMGAWHAGHVALLERARHECDVVLATIFVNPRQFEDPTDLANYPRTYDADHALALAHGVDALVTPTLEEMWPDGPAGATTVSVGELGRRFEGEGRPGHFDGVASVVAKLFVVTGPCTAFFGEKDYQQVAVVRQLVRDLGFDVTVTTVAIERAEDGLAWSSRNARLSEDGRARASALSRALREAAATPRPVPELRAGVRATMTTAGVEVVYAEIVDERTLEPLDDDAVGPARALVAGIVDGVRLLDNAPVTAGGESPCS